MVDGYELRSAVPQYLLDLNFLSSSSTLAASYHRILTDLGYLIIGRTPRNAIIIAALTSHHHHGTFDAHTTTTAHPTLESHSSFTSPATGQAEICGP